MQRIVIFKGREILPEYVKNFLSLRLLVCIVIYSHSAISMSLDIFEGTLLTQNTDGHKNVQQWAIVAVRE